MRQSPWNACHPACLGPARPNARGLLVLCASILASSAFPSSIALATPPLPPVAAQSLPPEWTLFPRTEPSPRSRHAMVYDTAREVAILFGDPDAFYHCGGLGFLGVQDVSEWNGAEWVHHFPGGPAPAARYDLALAYDSARGRTILFGGAGSNGCDFGPPDVYLGDTWEWNGSSWTEHTGAAPSPRRNHAMAYDAARGKVVLYGGFFETWEEGPIYLADTWEWDGSVWTEIAVPGPGPLAHHAMAYDAARGRIVLFGGRDATSPAGDTWEWNGAGWSLVAQTGPSPRVGHDMAFDSVRARVLLFGGHDGQAVEDLWSWNGIGWTPVVGPGPGERTDPAMTYDPQRDRLILFGGRDNLDPWSDTHYGDTWEHDAQSWALAKPAGLTARHFHAMTYDAARETAVLHGGSITGADFLGGTWERSDGVWTQVSTTGPGPRSQHAMAYDAARAVTVLYGGWTEAGLTSETWEWDGIEWTLSSIAGPGPRCRHSMVYDSDRARIVLFGGTNQVSAFQGDTWEWDGDAWSLRASSGPAARADHAMAYDEARSRTVLFGGRASVDLGDTWEWDGATWSQLPVLGPLRRSAHTLAYDEVRGTVVLFGGYSVPETLDDTWEWDGQAWEQLPVTGPPRRKYHAMVYDRAVHAVVLFGGWFFDHGSYDDTWELASLDPAAGPDGVHSLAGRRLTLYPPAPHPMERESRIIFEQPRASVTRAWLYDLEGSLVSTLVDGELGAGRHELMWTGVDATGRPIASGVYFLRLEHAATKLTRKVVVAR